jgi:hypothetical protein
MHVFCYLVNIAFLFVVNDFVVLVLFAVFIVFVAFLICCCFVVLSFFFFLFVLFFSYFFLSQNFRCFCYSVLIVLFLLVLFFGLITVPLVFVVVGSVFLL